MKGVDSLKRRVLCWLIARDPKSKKAYFDHPDVITDISPCWYSMDSDCSITGQYEEDVIEFARANGTTLVPLIANRSFDPEVAHAILLNDETRRKAAQNIADIVMGMDYDGINMDFEGPFFEGDRQKYSQLIEELAMLLRPHGKHLSVDVVSQTAPPRPGDTGWAQAYDYPSLEKAVDMHILMGYDYSPMDGPPGPVSPLPWLRQVIEYTLTCVDRKKIAVGLPFYGRHWVVENGVHSPGKGLDFHQIQELLGRPSIKRDWDSGAQCPFIRFTEEGKNHILYYDDAESLKLKLDLVKAYKINAVAFWRLGVEDPAIWQVLKEDFLAQ